ncbi:hypothetical protein CapIbe_022626 [Capra ibex]
MDLAGQRWEARQEKGGSGGRKKIRGQGSGPGAGGAGRWSGTRQGLAAKPCGFRGKQSLPGSMWKILVDSGPVRPPPAGAAPVPALILLSVLLQAPPAPHVSKVKSSGGGPDWMRARPQEGSGGGGLRGRSVVSHGGAREKDRRACFLAPQPQPASTHSKSRNVLLLCKVPGVPVEFLL